MQMTRDKAVKQQQQPQQQQATINKQLFVRATALQAALVALRSNYFDRCIEMKMQICREIIIALLKVVVIIIVGCF